MVCFGFLKQLLFCLYTYRIESANRFTGDLLPTLLKFAYLTQLHHPVHGRLYMIVPIAHTSTGQVVVSIQMIILFKIQEIMATMTCYHVVSWLLGYMLPVLHVGNTVITCSIPVYAHMTYFYSPSHIPECINKVYS